MGLGCGSPEIALSLVVPVFDEEDAIGPFMEQVYPILAQLETKWEIVFVNDGSVDRTLDKLKVLQGQDANIRVVNLTRNFGKEAALTAGLDFSRGRAVIPIDVDLQDPPHLIPALMEKWRQGYDIVVPIRATRKSDSFIKISTARIFYRIYNLMSEFRMPANAGDFRLIDRCTVEALKLLRERNRFMKGLLNWPGFKQATLAYERQPRRSGRTKWNYWKLWNLGLEGLTSFSTLPLRMWSYVGAVFAILSCCYGIFLIVRTLLHGIDVPGYASLMVVVLFLGSLQLMSLGIIGEYLGRVYKETKGRPIYVVGETYGFEAKDNPAQKQT